MPEPTAATLVPGRLALAGTVNLRDVGGLPVAGGGRIRTGLLLRGDAPCDLDDAGRAVLARRGLATVVDLRERGERTRRPGRLDGVGARLVELALYGADEGEPGARAGMDALLAPPLDFGALYLAVVARRGDRIARAVGALAAPGALPALVHCTGGKDRTGLVVGILLRALGVAQDDVLADYDRSGELLATLAPAELERRVAAGGPAGTRSVGVAAAIRTDRAWLAAALDAVGDARGWLEAHGLEPAALDVLTARLVAPGAAGSRAPGEAAA